MLVKSSFLLLSMMVTTLMTSSDQNYESTQENMCFAWTNVQCIPLFSKGRVELVGVYVYALFGKVGLHSVIISINYMYSESLSSGKHVHFLRNVSLLWGK